MKIIKKIIFGLFLLLWIIYLYIVISPKVFKNFYPFGIKFALVLTGSMEPTLQIDDFVIIKKSNNIKLDDIITYNDNTSKNEILHRVIAINETEIITKGDANNIADPPIDISQITGVYVRKIKHLGKIIAFMNKPLGISMTIILWFIMIIISLKKDNATNNE